MSLLGDATFGVLGAALTGLSKREQAIATNLSNIDTPGYQPVSVDFESALRDAAASAGAPVTGAMNGPAVGPQADVAMRRTDPRHFEAASASSGTGGASVQSFAGNLRNDGNTVDLESEMTALAETQLKYSAVSRLIAGKIGMVQDVATDRSS